MDFKTRPGRIYWENEAGSLLAEVLFPVGDDGVADIAHTFVDDSLRGQAVGEKLMIAAVESLRKEGRTARLTCTYARSWFPKHPQYADVLTGEP